MPFLPHDLQQAPPPPTGKARVASWLQSPRTDLAVVLGVLLSVSALLVEVAFHHDGSVARAARLVGDGLLVLFAIELLLRFWVAPQKTRFFQRYWLDLLSLVPLAQTLRLLRVLTLLRLLRAGKLLNRRVVLLGGRLRGNVLEFAFITALTLIFVLGGALVLALHPGAVPGMSGDLGDSLWWSGYTFLAGEPPAMPADRQGQLITLAVMFGGLNVFGVFVGTVSAAMVTALSRRIEVTSMDLDDLSDHLILLGWNGSAATLLRELFGETTSVLRGVVVVTEQPFPPETCPMEVPRELLFTHTGDFTRVEVLKTVGVERASRVIVLSDTSVHRSEADRDARTVLAALTIERIAPKVFCCAELVDAQHAPILRLAGVEEIVITNRTSGLVLGSVVRNQGLMALVDDLLSVRAGNAFHKIPAPPELVGQTVLTALTQLKQHDDVVLLSIERARPDGHRDELVNPAADERIRAGDALVVVGRGSPKR